MMGDLKSSKLILLKGFLFLALGMLASAIVIAKYPEASVVALLMIAIWSFCRFYYFAFYVIEHYVDQDYRFAGLGDFFMYVLKRRSVEKGNASDRPESQ